MRVAVPQGTPADSGFDAWSTHIGSLRYYWIQLRSSVWFLPFLMSLIAVGVALALLSCGESVSRALGLDWLRFADQDAARGMLESLLNGMITMTALVVSITMVVLTLAAGQLGPRLIRDFTDDFFTQFVLGLFIGAILYLLVVLHGLDTNKNGNASDLAITTGSLLCAICLFVLLLYINRLASSIVSNRLLRRVVMDTYETSDYLQDSTTQAPDREEEEQLVRNASQRGAPVKTAKEGYLENVDYASLLSACDRYDVLVRLTCLPGQWLNQGDVIAEVTPPEACSPRFERLLDKALAVGSTRTPSQDLEFGLQRLVEVGLRALSPSLNDSFTAIAAIDNIGAALARMFGSKRQQGALRGQNGKVRLLCPVVDWTTLINAGFDQMRQAGASLPAVAVRLIDTLGRLAQHIKYEEQRAALQEQLNAILESAKVDTMVPKDAALIRARHAAAGHALAVAMPGREATQRGFQLPVPDALHYASRPQRSRASPAGANGDGWAIPDGPPGAR